MDIDNFILSLPTLIMTSINEKYQLLNPSCSGNIFVSRNSLDSLSSNKFQYFFNVFLKSKEPFGFGSQSGDSTRRSKIIIEQIELEIQTDSLQKSKDYIQSLLMSRAYLLQKSLNSFLINTPLLSFLLQNPHPEIQPPDFEALCSFRQEADRSFLVESRLRGVKIGNHTISIGLYFLPSQAVPELVKEYLASTEITSADFNNLMGGSFRTESEGNLADQSWDLVFDPTEYKIETHYNEKDKSRSSSAGSQRPRTMSTDNKAIEAQKYIVARNKSKSAAEETEKPLKKQSILQRFQKGEILQEVGKEDEEFLQDLFENTNDLKEISEEEVLQGKNKGLVDEVMKAEMNFYKTLKA